jgi:regulator of protease activity HflC (stomatin/prohibitin superfamily)
MATNFEKKFEVFRRWANMIALPLSFVALFILPILGWWGWLVFDIFVFILLVAINVVWFVPTGTVGYVTVLNKLSDRTLRPGLNWIIPVVTDKYLMDTTVITKVISDTKKIKTRNEIKLEYTITYQLNEEYVSEVFRQMKSNYWDTHVSRWIDAKFDTIVSWLTYPEFQLRKDEIEDMASSLIAEEVDRKCREMSKDVVPMLSKTARYNVAKSTITVPSADDPTQDVTLEVSNIYEYLVDEPGVNFFKFIDLKINKVEFEESYEQARAKVAVAKAQTIEAEEKKKQIRILAESKKEAEILKAQGEAEALRLKGASENEVREAMGAILQKHPELLKEVLAQHYPKVVGGNTIVNLDNL